MIYEEVPDAMSGRTFVRLPGFAPRFDTYLKLEAENPAGSIKWKTAKEMLRTAEADGLLGPGSELIESTSGNLGIALASICAARGYRITLVTDLNASRHSIQHMVALGANVEVIRERDADGGYVSNRIDYIRRRLSEDPKMVWLNQYANPANIRAHREGTAAEISAGFGVPAWLFVGVGTSGTLMGCVEHFRDIRPSPVIVGVDALGSATFGGPAGVRWIPGLGSSRRPEIFSDDGQFRKVVVPELDAVRACRAVARDYGLLVGGSTGTVLAAVSAMRDQVRPGSRVLAVSPDLGDRYLDTVYDDEWVASRFDADGLADIPGGLSNEREDGC